MCNRPNCRQCNKPLAKYTEIDRCNTGEDPKSLIGTVRRHGWTRGREIKQITNGKMPGYVGDYFHIRVWCGDYGLRGDNLFCTQRCAVKFARRAARALRKEGLKLSDDR